jgi:hypothetical protein
MISQTNCGENEVPRATSAKRVRDGQHGGGTLRAIIWTAILLAFVFVCYKIIPPYYANYQFEDWLKTQVPFLMVNHTTDDALVAAIIKEMKSEGVTVTKENIKILQNTSQGINVQIDYNVPVDLIVYSTNLHFTPAMNSQALVQ